MLIPEKEKVESKLIFSLLNFNTESINVTTVLTDCKLHMV